MARSTQTPTAALVARLFGGARAANAARHAAKGTLLQHLARKAAIRLVLRLFGPRW